MNFWDGESNFGSKDVHGWNLGIIVINIELLRGPGVVLIDVLDKQMNLQREDVWTHLQSWRNFDH